MHKTQSLVFVVDSLINAGEYIGQQACMVFGAIYQAADLMHDVYEWKHAANRKYLRLQVLCGSLVSTVVSKCWFIHQEVL